LLELCCCGDADDDDNDVVVMRLVAVVVGEVCPDFLAAEGEECFATWALAAVMALSF
jgi:hypothetical protein